MKVSPTATFLGIASIAVVTTVAVGLKTVGDPSQARSRRLDANRLSDISRLSGAINAYRRAQGALPNSLQGLALRQGDFAPSSLRDPATGVAYAYRITGPDAYELCAVFSAASEDDAVLRWRHPAGRSCFAYRYQATGRLLDDTVIDIPRQPGA